MRRNPTLDFLEQFVDPPPGWHGRGAGQHRRGHYGAQTAEEELNRAYGQLRALTQRLTVAEEAERSRVARELPDKLGQLVAALRLNLSSLTNVLPVGESTRAEAVEKIRDATQLVDHMAAAIQRISTALRPGALDELGLLPAIQAHLQQVAWRTGVACDLVAPPEIWRLTFDAEADTAIFRIFQDLFTIVVRHANASTVRVEFAHLDGYLTVKVEDNGAGIAEGEDRRPGSLGILGMQERAAMLGGRLCLKGVDGRGTLARLEIPWPHESAGERLSESTGDRG